MKRIILFFAIASIMAACSKEPAYTDGAYTIEGTHNTKAAGTKTDFGTPGATSIPFVWSPGDKIWNGTQQSSEAVILSSGSATFSFSQLPSGTVIYNMTGESADMAQVPALQDASKSLGERGDFGWGTIVDNAFTLTHTTSYLWFEVTSLPDGYTLSSITFDAGDAAIAGRAKWNGSGFDAPTLSSTAIELTAAQESMNVMVVLPGELTTAKVLYKLKSGSSVKYAERTLSGRTLSAGATYKITAAISSEELFERRVLTFEDADAKFDAFTLYSGNFTITKWSDLIDNAQYGGPLLYNDFSTSDYTWYDQNNTELTHSFLDVYWGGGHAISNYVNATFQGKGYDSQLEIPIAPHSGSNFAVHYGYSDSYNVSLGYGAIQRISFADGEQRVIESMYITNTNYFLNSLVYGDGFNPAASESTWINLVIVGYDLEDNEVGRITVPLVSTGKQILMEWKRVNLTSLGKVFALGFNFAASSDQIGSYGLNAPAYFAYDDVVVRF